MIIFRCPLRISLIGGGTDLPEFFKNFGGGATISFTIKNYVYVGVHDLFESDAISLKYSEKEYVQKSSDIKHPYFKAVCQKYQITGTEIVSLADVPSGSGLGSSAAFANSLLASIKTYLGLSFSKSTIASEASQLEIGTLKKNIGVHDQYSTAFGGFRFWKFSSEGIVGKKVALTEDERLHIEKHSRLIFSGARHLNQHQVDQITVGKLNKEKIYLLQEYSKETHDLYSLLKINPLKAFPEILDVGWKFKQKTHAKLFNDQINYVIRVLRDFKNIKYRVLGSGGGGFLYIYTEKDSDFNEIQNFGINLHRINIEERGLQRVI